MTIATGSSSGTNGSRSALPHKPRPPNAHSSDCKANGPLTAENVFDYFSHSMFYDKQSNNQVLRMQTVHTGQSLANEAEELKCVVSSGVWKPPFTECRGISIIGGSPASSSPYRTQNLPRSSSFRSGRGSPLTRVSHETSQVRLKQLLNAPIYSSPHGHIFHHEQPYLPISGLIHRAFEPPSEPSYDSFHFLTGVQLELVDVAFVAANLTGYSENTQATFHTSHWICLANHGAGGNRNWAGPTGRETQEHG